MLLTVLILSLVQGETVNSFTRSNLKSAGFTGTNVWSLPEDAIFKGTSKNDSFLYMAMLSNDGKPMNAN